MRIISVISKKGGVGKTSTTLGLGASLASRGKNVLLLDLDSSNRTLSNLFFTPGMATMDALLGGSQALRGATPVRDNLSIIASHESMERVDDAAVARLWAYLPARLEEKSEFDYAILDVPGGWSLVNELAARATLGAAWGLCLLPVACAVESFESAQGTMNKLQALGDNASKRARLLLTMRTPAWQNSEDATLVSDLAHEAGMRFATAQVPMSAAMRRLSGDSQTPYDEGARAHHLRRAYDALSSEVSRLRV